jgi:predicted Ser/Thr protein kinase
MADQHSFLDEIAQRAQQDYAAHKWEADFETYLHDKVEVDPYKYTRTAFQLLHDMLDHFGAEEVEDAGEKFMRYRLFDDPFNAGLKAVFGLERTEAKLAAFIGAAAREEGKERIFVLMGPVGTAKTTLVDLIARGLEAYSASEAGEVFSITWRFPRTLEDDEAGGLGFVRTGPEEDRDDVFARVPCQMRDNPLLLIPRPERRRYLRDLFRRVYPDDRERPVLPRKIIEGELCYNCSQIYTYLMRGFDGDWTQVLRRIRVERFLMSELKGRGIGKVSPEGNVESASTYIAFDANYQALSMLLSDVSLVKFSGKYVQANRGLMHYSDIFKRPVSTLQHLLSAVEEHRVDFGEVGADIDVVLVGTTNAPEFIAFKQNVLSRGIQSRMRRIDVPYLLNFREERKIYEAGLREVTRTRHVAPHTTTLAAQWAVLTRLIRSQLFEAEDLSASEREAVKALSPVEKALLYAGEVPKSLSREERAAFTKEVVRKVRNEYPSEGLDGVSPRIVQNIFADICESSEYACVTPFEFFRKMNRMIEEGTEIHEFLMREPDGDYGDLQKNLASVIERYNETVRSEVESSLIDVEPSELDTKIRTYLNHVTAFLKREKVAASSTERVHSPDEGLMRFVEDKMGVEDADRDDFRFKILARATEAVKDGGTLDIPETYKDLYKSVLEGLYEEKRRRLHWSALKLALEKFDDDEAFAKVEEWTRRTAETLVRNMEERYGYCLHCARYVTFYVVDHDLIR